MNAEAWNTAREIVAQAGGVNEICGALAMAQREMANPSFDAQNPHFRNRYASLAAVRNAVIPVLAKHMIALTQDIRTHEGAVECTTRLYHSSGQILTFGPLTLPVSKSDAQGYGSAMTYCRRYQLMAVCGVVGDDDDDAEAAVGRNGNGKHLPNDDPTPSVSDAQAKKVAQEMLDVLAADISEDFKAMKVADMHDAINSLGGEPLYRAAWKVLASKPKERAQWKALHDLAKDKERSEHLNGHY